MRLSLCDSSGTPSGVHGVWGGLPGVSDALHPRLLSGTPSGVRPPWDPRVGEHSQSRQPDVHIAELDLAMHPGSLPSGTPSGVHGVWGGLPGVSDALHPRLLSGTPFGVLPVREPRIGEQSQPRRSDAHIVKRHAPGIPRLLPVRGASRPGCANLPGNTRSLGPGRPHCL